MGFHKGLDSIFSSASDNRIDSLNSYEVVSIQVNHLLELYPDGSFKNYITEESSKYFL